VLTRARLRDAIAKRTGVPQPAVAQVLDALEDLVREELLQQGEVVFRGLFRVTPVRRTYVSNPREVGAEPRNVHRIILTIRPTVSLRKKLTAVLAPR